MGWGGKRKGAGRKKKPATVLQHPSQPAVIVVPLPDVERFDPPAGLTDEERAVWLEQAPRAFDAGTLTRARSLAFARYCRTVILERREAQSSGVGGANHRGLQRFVHDLELAFRLTGDGKPAAVAKAEPVQQGNLSRFRG